MLVQLGESSYEYVDCLGTSLVVGGEGSGPTLTAFSRDNANHPSNCGQWPLANPGLYLSVYFRGYLASEGFPTGDFEVTDTDHVLVELSAADQAELPVGQPQDAYRSYRSDTPGSVGKVTSTFVRKIHAGRDLDLYRVDLADVELGFSEDGRPGLSYPDRATVTRATLYYTDPF